MSAPRPIPAAVAAAVLALALAGLLTACGSEREFNAVSITAELNEAGAGVELGETLPPSTDGVEIHELTLDHAAREKEEAGHSDGAGALLVLEDAEAAEEEFVRCESAIDFTCYRAANIVIRFIGMSPVDQQLISDSIKQIGTEQG